MHISNFIKLELKFGDYIWLMDEKGSGFFGNYNGNFESSQQTFEFSNHSTGQIETIDIEKLQRLEKK
jgi:hypothetical protein